MSIPGGFRSELGDNNSVESVENGPRNKFEEVKGQNLSKTRIDNDHTVGDNFNSQFDVTSMEDDNGFTIKEQMIRGYNMMGTDMSYNDQQHRTDGTDADASEFTSPDQPRKLLLNPNNSSGRAQDSMK